MLKPFFEESETNSLCRSLALSAAAITVVAILLRFFALGTIPGLLGDEAFGQAIGHAFQLGKTWTLQTPSGRTGSLIYAPFSMLFPTADPTTMRLPAAIAGVTTIVLVPLLLRTVLPLSGLLLTTALVAAFPFHILYSRIAWECALIPLAALFISAASLRSKHSLALLFVALGFLVHPSLLMMTLPVIGAYVGDPSTRALHSPRRLLSILAGLLIFGAGFIFFYRIPIYIPTLGTAWHYLLGLNQFLSGALLAQIPDPRNAPLWQLAFGVFLLFCLLRSRKIPPRQQGFFAGLVASLILLYLVRGIFPVLAGHERTILYSGVPFCLYLGILFGGSERSAKLGLLVPVSYLAVMFTLYFSPMIETGGRGVQSKSGPEDPKVSAARWILREKGAGHERIHVIVEDWSNYWVITNQFLASDKENFDLRYINETVGLPFAQRISTLDDLLRELRSTSILVGYRGGTIERMIRELLPRKRFSRIGFPDYSGQNHIYVWISE